MNRRSDSRLAPSRTTSLALLLIQNTDLVEILSTIYSVMRIPAWILPIAAPRGLPGSHASRVLVAVSRCNELLWNFIPAKTGRTGQVRDREDATAPAGAVRDAITLQT